jgi:hypothetical protein
MLVDSWVAGERISLQIPCVEGVTVDERWSHPDCRPLNVLPVLDPDEPQKD